MTDPTPTPPPWEREYREHVAATCDAIDQVGAAPTGDAKNRQLALAQVHATLAQAAATTGVVEQLGRLADAGDGTTWLQNLARDWPQPEPGGEPDAG
jgi:hypothetical protein